MTDALKLADMHLQQRDIEFERQRHLTNWLIESSPHMPKPAKPGQSSQQSPHKKSEKKLFTTSIFGDSFLFLSKFSSQSKRQNDVQLKGHTSQMPQQTAIPHPAPPINITPEFNSKTKLPLHIMHSSRDISKPKLRRFNSHDTSSNMFSVAEFENARLARRNELELVRQKQRYKMNSLSSGCDSSTGDSKGSKKSSQSKPESLIAEEFLDRYTLPRIVRLIGSNCHLDHNKKESVLHGHQSNSLLNIAKDKQNSYVWPPTHPTSIHPLCNNNLSDEFKVDGIENKQGELFLLYRHLKQYKIYHAEISRKSTNKTKGIRIPQDFSGYFSLVNEKGYPTATMYTTMIQLVRERVFKFLSVDNMQAYTESTSDNVCDKYHYVKITAKAGQVFRLLAVFEDGGQENKTHSHKKDDFNSIGRENEKGRYVQLMSESRQILYVSLSVKGKFYEIEDSNSKIHSPLKKSSRKKELNSDCIYRISNIITEDTILPINLKFISKQNHRLSGNAIMPEHIKVTRVSFENAVVACPIDESELCNPLHLTKIKLHPELKFIKCTLGFENEKLMFADTNVQNLIKFCQFNCDNFVQTINSEILQKDENLKSNSSNNIKEKPKTKTSSALSKFFSSSDKHDSIHEKEDSIIFLSKNDLEKLNLNKSQPPCLSNDNEKGWLSSAICIEESNLRGNLAGEPEKGESGAGANKSHSVDRYQDMSKLIQDRFRDMDLNLNNHNPKKVILPSDRNTMKSFETSYDLKEKNHKIIQKCFSLQNIEINNSMGASIPSQGLVKIDFHREESYDGAENNKKDKSFSRGSQSSNYSSLNRENDQKQPPQQSFITEKLLNEFYVKTKQYSKSSSSLQLLHFSIPQKMNIREKKKPYGEGYSQNKQEKANSSSQPQKTTPSKLEAGTSKNINFADDLMDSSFMLVDDLPYSSVRDSIRDQIEDTHIELQTPVENIYAEICQSNATTPAASESTSEISYKTDKHISSPSAEISHANKSITNLKGFKNVNSIKISFNSDSEKILTDNTNNITY